MRGRGIVTYSSAQSAASLRAASEGMGRLGFSLDFLHYSYFRDLPRRPNLLARFAVEEIRILRSVRSGDYSFAIIPGQLARYRPLSQFLRQARESGVDVYMYWHDCGWIMEHVRDRVGEDHLRRIKDTIHEYAPNHLVTSPTAFAAVNRELGIREAHCVWNTIPWSRFDQLPDDNPPLIVNVASVQLRKAPELFVDVAQYVCARHPTARFVWVGGSSGPALRSYLRSAGLHERVGFVGWSDDPGSWLRRASVLLFTSRSEAFGLVVAEALAAARTVIAFAGTGAADAVDDSGIIIQRYDTVKAAESVLGILEVPVGSRPNRRARERYEEMFTPAVYASRLAGVLEGRMDHLLTRT
jgi:glycosyltransferase involved in cell wall biosynthesis